jgi:uncharacterized protein (TIGR00369 family)
VEDIYKKKSWYNYFKEKVMSMDRRTTHGASPFWDHIGLKEVHLEGGYSELELPITPCLLQRRGNVHGGVLATLADAALGSAIRSTLSSNQGVVTVELKINYLKPAKGQLLVGKGSVIKRGRTICVGNAEIFDEQGEKVAFGNGTFMILNQ